MQGFALSAVPFGPVPFLNSEKELATTPKVEQPSPAPQAPHDYYQVLDVPTNTLATEMWTHFERKKKMLAEKKPADADAAQQLGLLQEARDVLSNMDQKAQYHESRLNGTAFVALTDAELDAKEKASQEQARLDKEVWARVDKLVEIPGNWMFSRMTARPLAVEQLKAEQPTRAWPAS